MEILTLTDRFIFNGILRQKKTEGSGKRARIFDMSAIPSSLMNMTANLCAVRKKLEAAGKSWKTWKGFTEFGAKDGTKERYLFPKRLHNPNNHTLLDKGKQLIHQAYANHDCRKNYLDF